MPIDLPKRIANNIDRFTGRAWLLPKILEWWDKSDERLFLLTGGPGTGKSMILAWLAGHGPVPAAAEAQRQLSALRAWVKAWHFCAAESGNPDPKVVAQHIADQLTRRVPGFGKALTATLADQVRIDSVLKDVTVQQGGSATGVYIGYLNLQGLSEELSFNRVLRDPLQQLYKDRYDQPMLLLFDALDEALTYSGATNVVQLLAKLSDLPPQVRILATTRDKPRVLKFFHMVKPFELIKDATPDIDDVRTYAEVRLGTLSVVEEVKRKDFAQRLARQAAGVFLYAAIVLDELLERPPSELPDLESYPLPDGLSGLYHQFLTRELGKDEPRWFELYEPLLGLIAVAQGDGLTTEQLMAFIGKDVRAALRSCKQYLTGQLPSGPFRMFHKSFTDFLLEDTENLDFHIDAQARHHHIAGYYWSKYRDDWSSCDKYGLTYLAYHLSESRQHDWIAEIISERWINARVAHDGHQYDGLASDLSRLWQRTTKQASLDVKQGIVAEAFIACVRIAMVKSRIQGLVARFGDALVKRAIETKVWTPEKALAEISLYQDVIVRSDLLIVLLKKRNAELPKTVRDAIVAQVREIAKCSTEETTRKRIIKDLEASITGESAPETTSTTLDSEDLDEQRTKLKQIREMDIHDINLDAYMHGYYAVRTTEHHLDELRSEAIVSLAPHLHPRLVTEALSIAQMINNRKLKSAALSALAPRLNEQELAGILIPHIFSDGRILATALNRLASQLPDAIKQRVVDKAVVAALEIDDPLDRVLQLIESAKILEGTEKDAVLEKVLCMAPGFGFEKVAWELRGELRGRLLEMALTKAKKSFPDDDGNPYPYHWAMAGLLLHHDPASAAFHLYNSTSDHEYAIVVQANYVAGALASTELERLTHQVLALESESLRSEGLIALAPWLKGAEFSLGLDAARLLDVSLRYSTLVAFAAHLPKGEQESLISESLSWVRACSSESERSNLLVQLAGLVTGPTREEAFRLATQIEDKRLLTETLSALERHSPLAEKERAVPTAIETSDQIGALNNVVDVSDRDAWVVREGRQCLVNDLLVLGERGTQDELISLFTDHLFVRVPFCSPVVLETIANILFEVSMVWTWPSLEVRSADSH